MKALFAKLALCIFALVMSLYLYIEKQNEVTKLKIELPQIAKEVRKLQEENQKYQYEIDLFENPNHLMELVRLSQFSYLKHPVVREVLSIPEGMALQENPKNIKIPKDKKNH